MSEPTSLKSLTSLDRLMLLNKIGDLALSSLDLDKLFPAAADLLRDGLRLQHLMIGTVDHPNGKLLTRGTAGIDTDLAASHQWQGLQDGIIGEAIRTGKTVVIDDVSRSKHYLPVIPSTRSELCIPLKVVHEPVGFLNIESDRRGAFERTDVELLETVGSFLAQAIRNVRLWSELENSKNYLESVVEHAGDGIVTFDREGRVRTWNSAAERILGRPREEVMCKNLVELAQRPNKSVQDILSRVLSGEIISGLQMKHATSEGVMRTFELSMAPVVERLGEVTGMSCILRDITEKIQTQTALQRNLQAMQLLIEVGKEMTSILELDELLRRIATLLRRVIEYEILGIFLHVPEREIMELRVAIGYAEETVEQLKNLPLGAGVVGQACEERRTILSSNLSQDPRAISAKTISGRWTQSEVAVPIVSRDRLLGGLVLESCDPGYFSADHVRILESLSSYLAISIDNARLFQDVLAKEKKLTADFALARDLQASMLPIAMPDLEDIEVVAAYEPAESLGGDYYDSLWLDDERLGLVVGDVSGKGVAAAMTMAATRSALRFAARMNSSPSQVLYHVNRRLYRDVKKRTYVTLFYGTLNVRTRTFRWCNAGHFPPILVRATGELEELSKGGTVVALFDKSRYSSGLTYLRPGDVLCMYTDGVIEALNRQEEEFGRERLEQILKDGATQPAKEILRFLKSELWKFTHDAPQHDDITILILKVREDA